MKIRSVYALFFVVVVSAGAARGQVSNPDGIGLPTSAQYNPGGSLVVESISLLSASPQPYTYFDDLSVNDPSLPSLITGEAIPGDIVITNGNGTTPDDWEGVLSFFNPSDPTGTLGMPATEMEAFFPDDVGPNGFSNFNLLADTIYNTVPNYESLGVFANGAVGEGVSDAVTFGPAGYALIGTEVITIFHAYDISVPEPASCGLIGMGCVGLLMRRRGRGISHL